MFYVFIYYYLLSLWNCEDSSEYGNWDVNSVYIPVNVLEKKKGNTHDNLTQVVF